MTLFDTELDQRQLLETIDDVVSDLLRELSIESPPVDCFTIAELLNWEVILDRKQPERGRVKQIGGRTTIFLQPDPRPERMQWALAHEIGESLSSNWISLVAEQQLRMQPELREELANIFATRLLLPQQWFAADVNAVEGDLAQLKELYQTASYQLIGMRLLDLEEISCITIFDERRMTTRRGNSGTTAPKLQPVEKKCWQQVHKTGEPCSEQAEGLLVECWPVHEPDFKREILRTRPVETFE